MAALSDRFSCIVYNSVCSHISTLDNDRVHFSESLAWNFIHPLLSFQFCFSASLMHGQREILEQVKMVFYASYCIFLAPLLYISYFTLVIRVL